MISEGVNLDHNFSVEFDKDELGSSSDPCSFEYRGKHPFSEKET